MEQDLYYLVRQSSGVYGVWDSTPGRILGLLEGMGLPTSALYKPCKSKEKALQAKAHLNAGEDVPPALFE